MALTNSKYSCIIRSKNLIAVIYRADMQFFGVDADTNIRDFKNYDMNKLADILSLSAVTPQM